MPHPNHKLRKKITFVSMGGTNAGDVYSSPLLFYNFDGYNTEQINDFNLVKKLENNIVIFGGGGILDTNKNRSSYYKNLNQSNIYFHWGSGSNRLNPEKTNWRPKKIELNIDDDILENFVYVGRRDYFSKYYNKHEYVPCVSCKIPQLQDDYKIEREIGVVQHKWLQQITNLNYPKTSMRLSNDVSEIIKFIGESEAIVTGSFHAAYWGLLMGKKVIINGAWSSKFDTIKYKPVSLSNNIKKDIEKCVIPPLEYLKECIELNDKFYDKILNFLSK